MTPTSRIIAALFVVTAACASRAEGLDRTKLPEDIRSDYDIFARKCSKCHSLSRPLQSGISDDEQWVNYVNRMRRQMGSGISYDDEDHILRFLRYYAAELRKKEAEKKGVVVAPAGDASPPTAAPPPTHEEPKDGG